MTAEYFKTHAYTYTRYAEWQLNNGMLVGDAEYPSLPFLLTPIDNPVTDTEIRFV